VGVEQFFLENAWLGGETLTANVLVKVKDGTISGVVLGEPAPADAVRLNGAVLPGFANVHSHTFHRALRGYGEEPGSFWSWRDAMYRLAGSLDPSLYYELARAVYIEMVLSGYTSVGEFHYLHHQDGSQPYDNKNAMGEALVAAAKDAGIRIALLDTCYLAAGPGRAPEGVQERFSDGSVDSWAERALSRRFDGEVGVGFAIHSARAVGPKEMVRIGEVAKSEKAVLHVHVSEQPRENAEILGAYGVTPTQLLADAGVLGKKTTLVHATHLSEEDLDAIALDPSTVCLCPTTERALADGIGPAGELDRRGVPLCIGSDAHVVIDPFEESRAVELDERLATLRRGTFSTSSLLSSATTVGHRALGFQSVGAIEVGMRCDLVAITTGSVAMAGADEAALLSMILYAGSPHDVTDVVVSGRHVVKNGEHRGEQHPAQVLAKAIAKARCPL
jgi:formiminoglutamate deiminase